MHPDLGLEETDREFERPADARRLSVRWLALPAEEQRQREDDMYRALLELAVGGERGQGRFLAGGFAEVPRALTPRTVELLVAHPFDVVLVERDGLPFVQAATTDGVRAVGVWLDPFKRERFRGS